METKNAVEASKATALVIGGNGFIGRHVREALVAAGVSVLTGTRLGNADPKRNSKVRWVPLHRECSKEDWTVALREVDIVINAAGILRQRRGESYEQVHHYAVASLANACARLDIRLLHISIMGTNSPAKSRFVTSKQRGEGALRASNADWYLVRPSLVDGEAGFGARWFRKMSALPVHFSPANALGRFAPETIGTKIICESSMGPPWGPITRVRGGSGFHYLQSFSCLVSISS